MRWLLIVAGLGALALWGRRMRSDRSETETRLAEAVGSVGASLLDVGVDVSRGAKSIWDDAVTSTGARAQGKSNAVIQPVGSLLGASPSELEPIEPQPA